MSSNFNSFPIKLLKRNLEILMEDGLVGSGAQNIYTGQIGINKINILGSATFNEEPPFMVNENINVGNQELYIFQNDVAFNSEITIKSGGEIRIVNNI
jgi:hypothetical protein